MDIKIVIASKADKELIQNLARFYVYDLSEFQKRKCPENGLFEDEDYTIYWTEDEYTPFIVKCNQELAGFALVDKGGSSKNIDFHIGEFFIVRKFRRKGVAMTVAKEIFSKHPGNWEVMAISNNLPAIEFWEKCIERYSKGAFSKSLEFHGTEMVVYRFSS